MKEYKCPEMDIDYFEDNGGLFTTATSHVEEGGGWGFDPFECETPTVSYDFEN